MTTTFYHYTTPEAAQQILRSGFIKKSTKIEGRRGDDARYGEGVYLTQVPPSTPKFIIAFNNYDGRGNSEAVDSQLQRIIGLKKVDAFVKLELDIDDVEECKDKQGRDIYLYPDSDLDFVESMKVEFGAVDHHQSQHPRLEL